jgi:ArsR family transcriptional regulator, lead/cadmium/zinc/bismuth-responsive transcriptional repressor
MTATLNPASAATATAVCEIDLIHPEIVARVLANLPSVAQMQRVAAIFQTLADPTRARIVAALAQAELCVCDVAAIAGLSVSSASHQLKRLRDQEVVTFRKEGRMAYYRLSDPHIRQLIVDGVAHVREGVAE